jgi:hypothetical protein
LAADPTGADGFSGTEGFAGTIAPAALGTLPVGIPALGSTCCAITGMDMPAINNAATIIRDFMASSTNDFVKTADTRCPILFRSRDEPPTDR